MPEIQLLVSLQELQGSQRLPIDKNVRHTSGNKEITNSKQLGHNEDS